MIVSNPNQIPIIEFYDILSEKLYLEYIQSCNSKEELQHYIKPKDNTTALHDKFIRYGTKKATSFIIIDIDNEHRSLEAYAKVIDKKLNGYQPSWITKTDNGFHVGFILRKPIWLRHSGIVKQAVFIKRALTMILNADKAGSHRLIGYWRNPITHKSLVSHKVHELNELSKAIEFYYNKNSHNSTKQLGLINTNTISNWRQIDRSTFIKGNRNNFLFRKVIGLLYQGHINNSQVQDTLEKLNQNELEQNEIDTIARSIRRYNIQTTKRNRQQLFFSKHLYQDEFLEHSLNNYMKKGKEVFIRQKLGQKITTGMIIKSTVDKLVQGYLKTYKNHEKFTNENIVKNSNVSKRTLQRYRNERNIENALKGLAIKLYLLEHLHKDVKADGTLRRKVANFAVSSMEFIHPSTHQVFKFEFDLKDKLTFYNIAHRKAKEKLPNFDSCKI